MATIVSWPLEETIISLVIHKLLKRSAGRHVASGRYERTVSVSRPSRCTESSSPARSARQLVNLRIRTLSTSPKPASVAIIDDPP